MSSPTGTGSAPESGQPVFYVDPYWEPTSEEPQPPLNRIVGAWIEQSDGTTRFEPNPRYEPIRDGSATDPVDAVLQLIPRGEASGDDLVDALRGANLGVAVDDDGDPVVVSAPDGVPSLQVVTAPWHQQETDGARWIATRTEELAALLPDEAVDVVLNPGGRCSMRVLAAAFRRAASAE